MFTESELQHLQRSIDLAKIALDNGDQPYGSVLVSAEGHVLAEDRNRIGNGDPTQHPEFALARWAADHMTADERANATVYTSGEHCPMCAAAHGLVGLGKIVYVSSSKQTAEWMKELGIGPSNVETLPIEEVIRDARVVGPVPELVEQVHELHRQYYANK
ncbi:nucleoside deaminase [Sporosarcina sp. PTS2304]|uniref:nucleoside deaminase n=1 Tax=Sporosarcina sp. PTS2304 TaxID=2283194 RepID=UPI000E0DB4AC|nr:nucleoside deaminase [Sporosarcina sp. PTS2304]AXH99781.1 nucleoside deaminase [Sporosarcina sp. PTS2304]